MKARNAISRIAAENGVSAAEVRKEIQKAIDEGMKSSDPKAIEFWRNFPTKNKKPTPEEVIEYISKKAREKM